MFQVHVRRLVEVQVLSSAPLLRDFPLRFSRLTLSAPRTDSETQLLWSVTFPQKSPPYTTLNGYGIFLFQCRFPKAVRQQCPSLVLFRRSLHTRCRRIAAERARRWWVIMDELARRFFADPAAYARAIELLSRYEASLMSG